MTGFILYNIILIDKQIKIDRLLTKLTFEYMQNGRDKKYKRTSRNRRRKQTS
jgi:hypothetical protein